MNQSMNSLSRIHAFFIVVKTESLNEGIIRSYTTICDR